MSYGFGCPTGLNQLVRLGLPGKEIRLRKGKIEEIDIPREVVTVGGFIVAAFVLKNEPHASSPLRYGPSSVDRVYELDIMSIEVHRSTFDPRVPNTKHILVEGTIESELTPMVTRGSSAVEHLGNGVNRYGDRVSKAHQNFLSKSAVKPRMADRNRRKGQHLLV